MRTVQQINELLQKLDDCIADELEDQDIDFKQWDTSSEKKSVDTLVQMAVCMANGGGGTVIFGVADRVASRKAAIKGIPPNIDVNLLKKAVYDRTDPKIMPVFDEILVPEGTRRILVMQIHPGLPPYTDTSGHGTIRIGKECQPLTGTLRRKISVETGETDFTAMQVHGSTDKLLSPVALEVLRNIARTENAPDDLMRLSDKELMRALGLARNGNMTKAAILLAGTEDALREHIPGYNWTFLKMASDTDYENRDDRTWAIPASVIRVEEHLLPYNPITTLQHGMFHFEYRTYPEIALREALTNAFCHADFRIAGPVMIKLYQNRIEISNNGGFIGGITEDNILHHQPVARNPMLMQAMTQLRLVNRSNLGISRMYSSLLSEGKEPPIIRENGDSVTLTFYQRELSPAFRLFVAEESQDGRNLNVDSLLILQYLLKHLEIDTSKAATLCQHSEEQTRELLSTMEQATYIERGGKKRGTYWTLSHKLTAKIGEYQNNEQRSRIDWDAAKTRILSILKERARHNEPGLSNTEIRHICHYDRLQAYRLMTELIKENPNIVKDGENRWARYNISK